MLYKKPRLFVWCDTPTVATGFGIVAKNLLRDLHKKYEVDILGINYQGDEKYDTNKWFIYPAMDYPDFVGMKKMSKLLPKINPDVIFLFQDIFHITDAWDMVQKQSPNSKKVIYFPIDGTPVNVSWKKPIVQADVVITYTEFAKQAILDTFPKLDPDKILTLDHGIDTNVFKPLPAEHIKAERASKGLNWGDRFVILNINRFQPRKLIPLTLRAAALFTKGYHVCKCGNWYLKGRGRCDLNGCSTDDITKTVPGHKDTLTYLHMVPREQGMGPGFANTLQSHAHNAGYRNSDLEGENVTLQLNDADIYSNPFPESTLNILYNSACVNISTTVGEGFGFSLAEAQATGTPTIAPYNSAIPEVLGENDHLINNVGHFNMAMDNGHVRPVVDVRGIIVALEVEYRKWKANNKQPVKNMAAVERCKKDFNWDDKRKFIEDIFEGVLEEGPHTEEAGKFILAAPENPVEGAPV